MLFFLREMYVYVNGGAGFAPRVRCFVVLLSVKSIVLRLAFDRNLGQYFQSPEYYEAGQKIKDIEAAQVAS